LAFTRGIVVMGSGGGASSLDENVSFVEFPFRYRLLYHVVDLSALRTETGEPPPSIDEGTLLFTMLNRQDAPVPRGEGMQDFMRRIEASERDEVRLTIDRLERDGYVAVEHHDEVGALWTMSPTSLATSLMHKWIRIRLRYLESQTVALQEQIDETRQGWRLWAHELLGPPTWSLVVGTALGAIVVFLLTHFFFRA
jgi:hypothetical protein